MTEKFEPCMYVFMRKDIACMNPGKGMAQSHHNGVYNGIMMAEMIASAKQSQVVDDVTNAVDRWLGDRFFGVTYTLAATEAEWKQVAKMASEENMLICNIQDPTYPMHNHYGEYFAVDVATCWSIFVHSPGPTYDYIKTNFDLHP